MPLVRFRPRLKPHARHTCTVYSKAHKAQIMQVHATQLIKYWQLKHSVSHLVLVAQCDPQEGGQVEHHEPRQEVEEVVHVARVEVARQPLGAKHSLGAGLRWDAARRTQAAVVA